MKLTVFIFCLGWSLIIDAQSYKPLLNDFNEWRFTNCYLGSCLDDTYYTDGDTTYGGYQYKILNGFHFISETFWLREDSINQKVYLSYEDVVSGSGLRKEDLLYDFSLQVGDSIDMKNPITPFIAKAGYFRVDSIVMELLQDGNTYKHYYFSPSESNEISTNTAEWIEGLGSLSLINAPSGFPDANGVGKLSCFFKNGMLFYSNLDFTTSCIPNIVSNIKEDAIRLDDLRVYPTFVDNTCHITGIKNMQSVTVYTVTGTLVQHKSLYNISQVDLHLDKLKSGIYFLVFLDEKNHQRNFKVIKK